MAERAFATQPKSLNRNWLQRQTVLSIGAPGDAYEREADRVAGAVTRGRHANPAGLSLARIPITRLQCDNGGKPESEEEKYKTAALKLGEAFLATDIGKKLKEKVEQDPLVKGVKEAGASFIGTLPGKVISGAAAAVVVAALAATHKGLPAQIPEIPLDKLTPGFKVKITYNGPVDHPSQAMISFSYTEQIAPPKKPAKTRAEMQREENARLATEQARFRAGLRYAPGTPEARQQQMEEEALRRAAASRLGQIPSMGAVAHFPNLSQQPTAYRLQLPGVGYRPQRFSLLDEELKLKPLEETAPSEAPDKKKKESGAALQPKARHDSRSNGVPPIVNAALDTPGQPLDSATREDMESHFGHDFRQVRVHTDTFATQSTRSINAAAYTVGANVVFDHGCYAPRTPKGRWLLAHELSHVLQQSDVSTRVPRPGGTGITPVWEGRDAGASFYTAPQKPMASYLQRAEHGTYVSKISNTGEPAYLDGGERFYRRWGHPNVKRVSTMMEIISDLNKAKRPIERFRIVSHGNSTGIEVGLLPEIAPVWFGKDAAEFTTQERFRKKFVDLRLVTENYFQRIYDALNKDATALGVTHLLIHTL